MNMLTDVREMLSGDLAALRSEIERFPSEALLWKTLPGVTNSAGNLTLHLTGNLQHFLGATLGGSGYVRNREAEFTRRDLPRATLLQEIDAAREAVSRGLTALSERDLDAVYPLEKDGAPVTTGYMLLRLCRHLAYHLGQINYLRRYLES
jgi:hypothetical protein